MNIHLFRPLARSLGSLSLAASLLAIPAWSAPAAAPTAAPPAKAAAASPAATPAAPAATATPSKPATPAAPAATAAPAKPAEPAKPAAEAVSTGKKDLSGALQALGRAQTLLEYYFLETGSYPDSLDEMLMQYNQGLHNDEKPVIIPKDPSTGRRLVYVPNAEHNAYQLSVPDASVYGQATLGLSQVEWGWMSSIATEARRKRMVVRCSQYQELLVSTVMQYNRDNRNKFPTSLESLMPKYLKAVPACPVCKKAYVYKKDGERSAEVSCPDPSSHGLEVFRFNSNEGLKRYP